VAESDPKRNETREELVRDVRTKHGDSIAGVVERFINGEITEKPRRYYEPTEE
jgi:hypothetical protein